MRPVIWSDGAQQDYFDILRLVAADNPASAYRVVDVIEATGERLGQFATGRAGRVSGTYEKPVPRLPYVIVYSLVLDQGQETVFVLRVIHAARDWPPESGPE